MKDKPHSAKKADDDTGKENAWPTAPPSLADQPPPGKYDIAFRHALIVERFDRRNVEALFDIIEPGAWYGLPVKFYFPLPATGTPSVTSKYYRAWVSANGGIPPKRGDRMTPKVFRGYWRAEICHTRRVATRSGCRELDGGQPGVAIVDHLIERLAGGRSSP